MKKTTWILVAVVAVAIGVSAYLHNRGEPEPAAPAAPPVAEAPAAKPEPAEPAIRHPIERAENEALPPLDASDAVVTQSVATLLGERALELLHLNGFVRRVVATIDNAPRERIALRLMPVKSASGPFRTRAKDGEVTISPDNSARYTPYLQLVKHVDASKLVSVYVRLYPLFQQAYEDLGYPGAHFNDRLIEVIDHLLEAPALPDGAKLVQRKVLYEFANPELEHRSAGQKILLRIGNENAAILKAKLREIRGALLRAGPPDRAF